MEKNKEKTIEDYIIKGAFIGTGIVVLIFMIMFLSLIMIDKKQHRDNRLELCRHFLEAKHPDLSIEEQLHYYKLDKTQAKHYCLNPLNY